MALTNGQTYYYSIFTYDSNGNFSVAATASGVPNIVVDPVTIIDAVGGDGSITVSWSKSDIATSYKIYYGTEPGGYNAPLSIATGDLLDAENPSYIISAGLSNNVTYWLAVAGIYSGVESEKSAEVSVITGSPSSIAQPANLEIQNGDAAIRLTWDIALPAVDGYYIRYGTSSSVYTGTGATEGNSPIQINENIATVDIHGLTNDTIYYFAIQAFRGAQLSPMSDEVIGLPQAGLTEFTTGDVVTMQLGAGFNLVGMPVAAQNMTVRSMTSKMGGTVVYWREGGKFKSSIISVPSGQQDKPIEGGDAYHINVPTAVIPPGGIKTVKFSGEPWKQE